MFQGGTMKAKNQVGRPPSLTEQQTQYIVKATEAGMTTRSIANEIGVSHITVSRYQRKHGIKRKEPKLTFNNTI